MRILVFVALGLLVASFLIVWIITRVRYRITSRYLKVTLFGVVLRRVRLADIESVSKRRGPGLTEHWLSTTRPKHRMLVIRRRRGLCKNLIITPRNRYVFKTALERAVRRTGTDLDPQNMSTASEGSAD